MVGSLVTEARAAVSQPATETIAAWANDRLAQPLDTDRPPLDLVARLGAHPVDDAVRFGFWVSHLRTDPAGTVELELCEPPPDLDFTQEEQTVEFRRSTFPAATSPLTLGDAQGAVFVGR